MRFLKIFVSVTFAKEIEFPGSPCYLGQAEFREISKPSFSILNGHLSLKWSFESNFERENRKNDNQGEFPDLNDFTLCMIFDFFTTVFTTGQA